MRWGVSMGRSSYSSLRTRFPEMRVDPRLFGVAIVAVAYRALWWGPRHVRLTRRAVALPRWPEHLDGLRVAVVADLHTGAPHVSLAKVSRVVERVNAERPDVVALLGDYVDPRVAGTTPVAPAAVAAALGRLRAPLGVAAGPRNPDLGEGGRGVPSALV